MSLHDAYSLFYGETNLDITESYILNHCTLDELRKKKRTLTKKYHPDINHDKSIDETKIMENVNLAYDLLSGILKDKKDSKKTVKKDVYRDTNAFIHSHRELNNMLKVAYIIKEYDIYNELYRMTDYYYKEIKKSSSCINVYKNYCEYSKFLENIIGRKNEYDVDYKKIVNYYKSRDCDDRVVEYFLRNFSGRNYHNLNDIMYSVELETRLKSLQSENNMKNFYDKKSFILNIKNIFVMAITNSLKLNEFLGYSTLYKEGLKTLEVLKNGMNTGLKVTAYQEYQKLENHILNVITCWKNNEQNFCRDLIKLPEKEIDMDFASRLDDKLKDVLLDCNNLFLLFDEDGLNFILKNKFQKNLHGYKKIDCNIKKMWKTLVNTMNMDSKEYKHSLSVINNLLSLYGKKIMDDKNDSSIKENSNHEEKIITRYFYYKSKSSIYKSKGINLFLEIFIKYYYGYKDSVIPYNIINLYNNLNTDYVDIDAIYSSLYKYYLMVTDEYYTSTKKKFRLDDKCINDNARKRLLSDINNLVVSLYNQDYEFDNDIKKLLVGGIDNLDITDLYKLLTKLDKIYNKFYRFVPFKIK